MRRMVTGLFGGAALFLEQAGHGAAAETLVDLELVLAVDVSGSMDAEEQEVQRRGYALAFTHPEVIAAIRSGPFGRIAVAYVEWAGASAQAVTVPWTLLEGGDTAEAFVTALAAAPMARVYGTSISGGLLFSAPLFENNGYESLRRVIDVSGDGPNNMGAPLVPTRDAVVAAGIVINGLPIAIRPSGSWSLSSTDLVAYYRECVIGGPGSFALSVTAADQLAEAIRQKLVLEIAGHPPRLVPTASTRPAPAVDCLIGERLRRVWEREP